MKFEKGAEKEFQREELVEFFAAKSKIYPISDLDFTILARMNLVDKEVLARIKLLEI